ncbi:hypothetical protein [uncultured Thiodictyon sp.]|uniref:hypothetical protein n=1 Tax=uncultured Thiodictyon sp. TaxID=1846217 RepID=UPI0025CC7721|nr:hypothetical protein [uncultured Thiodictyon sp.]
MIWRKLGNVYCPAKDGRYTHAMFPEVDCLDEGTGRIRVYYTHRDSRNYGFPTFLDAELVGERFTIIYNHHEPIMGKGDIGNFDDSGANITSLVKVGGKRRFYYYGWNLGVTVPFRNSIGVAEAGSDDKDVHLTRLFPGPILDRAARFPGLCATPCVIRVGDVYRMYFTQGLPWIINEGKPNVACHIAYAESQDGLVWHRADAPAVENLPTDHVLTTPFVMMHHGVYKMWYSYRGSKYRIGYAESIDGKMFRRKDTEVGITVSASGWDSEMVCYPKVFKLNGTYYMIYCGNDYARTGFGLAVMDA